MEMIYAERSEVIVNEMTAFRATWEPMLIIDSRMVTARETITELRGMFQPGVTCQRGQLGLFEREFGGRWDAYVCEEG